VSEVFDSFLIISVSTLNLFSFILGMVYALSFTYYRRNFVWMQVVGYFAVLALFFYATSGGFAP
jgi:hypothetical protein